LFQTLQKIENQHPGLVKVALIRAYELKLYDDNEVEIASELANTNNSILDIAEELNMARWIKYQADEWYALNSRDYRLGNVDGIELGKVYGPFKLEYETYFVQVEEVKLVSRLRPSTRVNTDWKYAINYAESDLNFQQRYGGVDPYLDTLWDSHTVLLDGEPLKKSTHYPNCLDQ